jgi:hypothetical protein
MKKQARNPGLSPIVARYGRELAGWLNDSKGTPENRRVCHLIQLFEAVRSSVTGYYWPIAAIVDGRRFSGKIPREIASEDGGAVKNPKYATHMSRLQRKFKREVFSIFETLQSYKYYLHPDYPLDRQWLISWEAAGKRPRRNSFCLDEHGAVRLLYEIVVDGELTLARLRRCDCGCGAWLFGLRCTKSFSSDKCRQKANDARKRSSPAYLKQRAKYMREYREKWE